MSRGNRGVRQPPRRTTDIVAVERRVSGPLPAPELLAGYDQVQAGFAERIVAMAEREQDSRLALSKEGQTAFIATIRRGQNYALLIAQPRPH